MTLLEILQPTNVPKYNPKLGRVYYMKDMDAKVGRPKAPPPLAPITELKCKTCGEVKPAAQFVVCKDCITGYTNACKRCISIAKKRRKQDAKAIKKSSVNSA